MKPLGKLSLISGAVVLTLVISISIAASDNIQSKPFVAVMLIEYGNDQSVIQEVTVWPDGTTQTRGIYGFNRKTGQPSDQAETPAVITEILDPVNRTMTTMDAKSGAYLTNGMTVTGAMIRTRPKHATCREEFPMGPCTPGPTVHGFKTFRVGQDREFQTESLVAPELGWFVVQRGVQDKAEGVTSVTETAIRIQQEDNPYRIKPQGKKFDNIAGFTVETEKARGRMLHKEVYEKLQEKHRIREAALKAETGEQQARFYARLAMSTFKRNWPAAIR